MALLVFVATTSVAAASLWHTRNRHLGIHEDHFDKGVLLYETGSMSSTAVPSIFRPPGYPFFIAGTLAVRDAVINAARRILGDTMPRIGSRVTALVAHALLAGLIGVAIFGFAVRRTSRLIAVACAVAVACSPLLLIIATQVSYPLLHVAIVTIASLALLDQAAQWPRARVGIVLAGVLWGAATLVKSVTLITPPILLLWAWLHYGIRMAMVTAALFTAGMLLVVAPYTARNYIATHRFIPVNAQASFALWGTSLHRIPPGQRYLTWMELWFESGMSTYTQVTGISEYRPVAFESHLLDLSDRFEQMAWNNLRADPTVYADNAIHNSIRFLIDLPTAFWLSEYLGRGSSQTSVARVIAVSSIAIMTIVGLAGLILGCLRRDPRWTLVLALFVTIWVAHAFTFLEARYLYVKLPTLFVAFVLALVDFSTASRPTWSRRTAQIVATFMAVLSIVGVCVL